MRKKSIIVIIAAFALGGVIGTLAWLAIGYAKETMLSSGRPTWTEVAWPFLVDEWGKGKAFRCRATDCGTEVHLYIRAKIGFCNCTTGVSDDDELDRLTDFALMGEKIANLGPGRPISVAHMQGRSRTHAIAKPVLSGKSGLSMAFNDRCDAIVATVVLDQDRPGAIEPQVIEFLNGKTVMSWAETTLGL